MEETVGTELFQAMAQSVIDGEAKAAEQTAKQSIERGIDPLDAINEGFVVGMNFVGEQFSLNELFIPDLVMAGEAMKAALGVLERELAKSGAQRQTLGKVVLGTVRGDIHEIGKNLVGTMLSANGFRVYDLGVDVPIEAFVEKAREVDADIVGISSLLTTTMAYQRDVVLALEAHGMLPRVKVMVGGAPVSSAWAEEIGANGYGEDATGAVALAKKLVNA